VTNNFASGNNLLIGFKFLNPSDSNNVDFGWAHVNFDASTGSTAIQDWAYACGGTPIAAGDQTSSTTSCAPGGGGGGGTAPEPSSLALLALGAAGLAAFRRRKREEPAAAAA
jgi:hypothetical protein